MELDELMLKIHLVEGLAIALNVILDNDINVLPEYNEPFSAVCSIAEVLKDKIQEIRSEVSKNI